MAEFQGIATTLTSFFLIVFEDEHDEVDMVIETARAAIAHIMAYQRCIEQT